MMFSSKRDLVDLIYIFPLLIFSYGFYYIFDLKLDFLTQNKVLLEEIFNFIKQVNLFLFISLTINVILLALLFMTKLFMTKKLIRRNL